MASAWCVVRSRMADDQVIAKVGRVTDPIAPGLTGTVIINVRGGSEEYAAMSHDDIAVGRLAIVVDQIGPRTLLVADHL
jgi:membrane-bound ClpP family serine protease